MVANPSLDSGCPTRMLQARWDEVPWQWQETNETNTTGNERKTDTGGTNLLSNMGLSVTSCVDDEGPTSYVPEHRKKIIRGRVRIRYRAWALTCCNVPFWKLSGFWNCGIELVTPIMENIKVSWLKLLAHAGTVLYMI